MRRGTISQSSVVNSYKDFNLTIKNEKNDFLHIPKDNGLNFENISPLGSTTKKLNAMKAGEFEWGKYFNKIPFTILITFRLL